jgi:hypothetical protein
VSAAAFQEVSHCRLSQLHEADHVHGYGIDIEAGIQASIQMPGSGTDDHEIGATEFNDERLEDRRCIIASDVHVPHDGVGRKCLPNGFEPIDSTCHQAESPALPIQLMRQCFAVPEEAPMMIAVRRNCVFPPCGHHKLRDENESTVTRSKKTPGPAMSTARYFRQCLGTVMRRIRIETREIQGQGSPGEERS